MTAFHDLRHPSAPITASAWSEAQTLHVACAYSNPIRWRTRRELMLDFRRHAAALPNIVLHVGELAYGDRPHEVTDAGHPLDYQWRTRHELWHKENLLNLIVQRFPPDWKYGAYVDGDFHFTRHDWALEAVHQLQHYDWVQLFSSYSDLSRGHEVQKLTRSFASRWVGGEISAATLYAARRGVPYSGPAGAHPAARIAATGGAWAFRREAFSGVGGFLDTCILGSGDWHMAFGLAGEVDTHPQTKELTNCGKAYARSISAWQNRASQYMNRNVGVVNCHAVHHYHGSKDKRGYDKRWMILRDHDFDPYVDIYRDSQGVWQLTGNKPAMRDAIRAYFRSRNEDE